MTIDGLEAKIEDNGTVDLALFRSAIGLIPQDPILFRTSVRENLSPLKEHTDSDIVAALHRVGLGPWFLTLPEGLEFALEERGGNLSAGQRQLLCMARCLLHASPIILMDEATSAVDPHSEVLLVQALEHHLKERTQIIVAHRLSTLERCDEIIWIERGKIYKQGKPADVVAEFRQMNIH